MGAGAELRAELVEIAAKVGTFPHAKLAMVSAMVKKQPTRLLKAFCAESGYCVRVTAKWLEEFGAPICPHCGEEFAIEEK